MAFAYDLLRLFRRLVRHGRLAVDLEDLLYWTLCFLASFTLLYYGNNGVIRFVAVLGAALGMLVYSLSMGRIFVKFSYFLINKTIGSVFRFLCKIIKKLHKIVSSVNRKNKRFLKSVGIFNKIQKIFGYVLTYKIFHHRMNVHRDFFMANHDKIASMRQAQSICPMRKDHKSAIYDKNSGSHTKKERSRSDVEKKIKKKKDARIQTRQE